MRLADMFCKRLRTVPCGMRCPAWRCQDTVAAGTTDSSHQNFHSADKSRCIHISSAATDASSVQNQVTYESVIGIETHVQLKTDTKAFCRCRNEYGATPNKHICPVCTGQPGALPTPNAQAARLGALAGLALNCSIARVSKFDRKQYFYPDLPKGYQISQFDEPLCGEGKLDILWQESQKVGKKTKKVLNEKTIGITRAHLEEDAGKNTHASGHNYSLVDLNRAGVPLLEIVTEPDFRTGAEAAAFGEELRRIVRFLGISDGNMQEGSLRCDVNVSVRPEGQQELGTKVEIKNMNSFSAMRQAIEYEVKRQSALLAEGKGGDIVQETRLFDEATQETRSMRKKEGLADYRYFPEPDLPPLLLTDAEIAALKAGMPELPAQLRARLRGLKLPEDVVLLLAEDVATAAYFDACIAAGADAVQAANWIQRDILGWCKENKVSINEVEISPRVLAEAIALIADGTISSKIAKELAPELLEGVAEGTGVAALVEERGMGQISNEADICAIIQAVVAANPKQAEQYRGGKSKLQGFFQGQVMKESGGRVNPEMLARLLPAQLSGDSESEA